LLYYLSFPLAMTYSGFNVFRYITFRAAMAALLALLISFLLGPWLIRTLTEKQIGQQIRDDGPASHAVKAGTPTMGGALIILALLFSTLMMADIANRYVLLALLATLGTGVVGFTDDYLKLTHKNSRGLSPRGKLLGQLLVAFIVAVALYYQPRFSTDIAVPFVKTFHFDLERLGERFEEFDCIISCEADVQGETCFEGDSLRRSSGLVGDELDHSMNEIGIHRPHQQKAQMQPLSIYFCLTS